MNKEIENYINSKVLPLYENNDESHSLSHINNVINYSLQLVIYFHTIKVLRHISSH